MKLLSISSQKNKLEITIFNKTFTIDKTSEIYRTIMASWNMQGFSQELFSTLSLMYFNSRFWKPMYSDIWLVYICLLLQKEDNNTAIKVLNHYISLFGITGIEEFLPVAKLAFSNNISSPKIEDAAKLFDLLEVNAKSNSWIEAIKDKSIAIVGNGTQLKGSKKGNEIDSHDIVIRFNKFVTKGFEEDCGSKTNIWVTNTFLQEAINVDDLDFVILNTAFLYWNCKINAQFVKKIIKNNDRVHVLPYETLKYARECFETDFYCPTTGASLILTLYMQLKNFNKIDFYGFGFLNEEFKPLDHYYTKVSKRHSLKAQIFHNFEEECRFLKRLIQNKDFKN